MDKSLNVVQLPLSQIKPNPKNRLVTQDAIDAMAASLEAIGQRNAVKVLPRSDDGTYSLISGHIRRAGALKLGWETIKADILDITPAEAVLEGITDNKNTAQTWLDDYRDIENLEEAFPDMTIPELAQRLGMGDTSIKRGQRLLRCLNSESRTLIDQCYAQSRAAKAKISRTSTDSGQPKDQISRTSTDLTTAWELTEDPAYRLTQLEDQKRVLEALQVVINRRLTAPQAQKLVAWVQAGNPADTFDQKAAKPAYAKASTFAKAPVDTSAGMPAPKSKPTVHTTPAANTEPVAPTDTPIKDASTTPQGDPPSESTQPAHAATHTPKAATSPTDPMSEAAASSHKESGTSKASSSPGGDRSTGDLGTAEASSHKGAGTSKASSSTGDLGTAEQTAWEALLGISVLGKIKAKVKKGERPNGWETLLLLLDKLTHGLFWMVKKTFKGIKGTIQFFWKGFVDLLKAFKLYEPAKKWGLAVGFTLFVVGGVCLIVNGVSYSLRWVGGKVWHAVVSAKAAPTPQSSPVASPANPQQTPAPQQAVAPMPAQPTVSAQMPVSVVEVKPTAENIPAPVAEPAKKAVVAKAEPTTAPTIVPTQVVQITPTVQKGDLFTQGADAATKGINAADVVKHLLPF